MPVIGKGAKSLRKKNIFSQNVSAMATLDSVAPTVTGTLDIGQTTFAVPPSLYNQNPTAQVGAISVYRNGQIQARCVDNDISKDGNYIEVAPVSGTLFSTIQFKQAPVNEADNIAILTNGLLVPRPSSSQQAEVETLGAKMDKVVSVLSDVSGQPTSYFQTAPSQVDLTNFGSTVVAHESRIAALETPIYINNTTLGQTSTVSANTPVDVIGSTLIVPAGGSYELILECNVYLENTTAAATYMNGSIGIYDSLNVLQDSALAQFYTTSSATANRDSMYHVRLTARVSAGTYKLRIACGQSSATAFFSFYTLGTPSYKWYAKKVGA